MEREIRPSESKRGRGLGHSIVALDDAAAAREEKLQIVSGLDRRVSFPDGCEEKIVSAAQ